MARHFTSNPFVMFPHLRAILPHLAPVVATLYFPANDIDTGPRLEYVGSIDQPHEETFRKFSTFLWEVVPDPVEVVVCHVYLKFLCRIRPLGPAQIPDL